MSAVLRLAHNRDVVAIKMGRRQGARSARIWMDTQPIPRPRDAAGPFSSQPSGPRRVGCFSALLAPYVSDLDMLVARALKNSQLTRGDAIIICETVH
jgi:hypothetical protein